MTPADFDFIKRLMRRVTGNDLPAGKEYLVEGRLEPIAKERKLDVAGLVNLLRNGKTDFALERSVAEALTTNETSFFRDLSFFQTFEREVLPALVKESGAKKLLRVWCAAASTGQEPYTLGMILDGALGPMVGFRTEILATDYNDAVLEYAKAGVYSTLEVGRGLPGPLLLKYFDSDGPRWKVKPNLRARIEFKLQNLVEPFPPLPPFDLVFLRNVLIYFDLPTRRDILTKVRVRLRKDGVLAIGRSETLQGVDDRFAPMGNGTGFFRVSG